MCTSTLDPISMNDIIDLENSPFVVDGDLKIYFETEANKNEYLDIPMHGTENSSALDKIFNEAAASSITGSIN